MISKNDIERLVQREARDGSPVLSIYLDTDQSEAINVQRAFEVVFKNMLRDVGQSLDKDQRLAFLADAERVTKFLGDYREPQRGLVVFADDSEDFFSVHELKVKVRNGLWWRDTPYARPLIEILDEHERYGVILTDREHARLFTVFLGEIEEHLDVFASADVTHIKTTGTDHMRSQMNIERKGDLHARWHLKRVAELMSKVASIYQFDRLILGGTIEAVSELQGLLPKALRTRVVARISLPVDAGESQVLAETSKVEQDVERKREAELVESLITAAAKQKKAARGLDDTLLALQEYRIWELVYADGFAPSGSQCTNCGSLLSKATEPCGYCGQAVRPVSDLMQLAAARVLDMEGKVEQVGGDAGARMKKEAGSVGALLRF